MALNNKEQFIQSGFQEFQPVVSEGLAQLFQREFTFAFGEFVDGGAEAQTASQEYPCVFVSLNGDAKHQITIPLGLAANLYGWMLGMDAPEDANDEVLEGLQEAANQIIGQLQAAVDGTELSFQANDVAVKKVTSESDMAGLIPAGNTGIVMTYSLGVEGQTHTIRHFCQGLSFKVAAPKAEPTIPEENEEMSSDSDFGDQDETETETETGWEPPVDVHRAEFDTINSKSGTTGKPRNISMLLDVELEVYVELGRKRMKIQDLLKLGKGSLIELDRSAGEPLSIFIGDKKLAEGEVVVVDERFGIRITQLIGPKERIKSLV